MSSSPRPTLVDLVETLKHREETRRKISELSGQKSGLILDYWKGFLPYFLRGSFYSLIQALELFLLIRLDFFFLPSGSLKLLTFLSVGHTAAICLALSLRRLPHSPQFQKLLAPGEDEKSLLQSLILDLSLMFLIGTFVALSLLTFQSDLHFSSPPIYRAMITTWFLALPLEAGILMGLFTATQRSLILKRGSITRIQILQSLVGCLAVIFHYPLLYLASYLVGLFTCLRLLFPERTLVKTSRSSLGIVLSLVRRAFPATSMELAGKLLYLPLVYLDPSFGFFAVVMQRVMHVTTAVGLRISDLSQRSFLRYLAFGDSKMRRFGLRAVTRLFLWAIPLLLLLVFPVVLLKNSVLSWSSPYDERLHLSALPALVFLGITFLRAFLSSQVRLLDECEFACRRTRPLIGGRFWGTLFGLFSLSSAIVLSQSLPRVFPELRVRELLSIFLFADAFVCLVQFVLLRYLFHRIWRAPWKKQYCWIEEKDWPQNLWLLEADRGHRFEASSSSSLRLSERHLLLALPEGQSPGSRPDATHFEYFPLFSDKEVLRGDELGLLRLFQSAYTGKAEIRPRAREFQRRERESLGETPLNEAKLSIETVKRLFPHAEVLALNELLLKRDEDIDPNLLQYLDLLSARGSLIPIRGGRKSLRGVMHLNAGLVPRYLLRLPLEKRELSHGYSFKAFVLNVLSAQKTS